ncbi:MAG TPA: hypothetical protein VFN65_08985 [Solirubrobacteraceae bacterium]|nr:hypothetical protein [Solirubrobacteraceae bacterium]
MRQNSLPFSAVSAADQPAVAELENPLDDHRLRLRHVVASYGGGTPSRGLLTISDGADVDWKIDLPDGRPVVLQALDLQCGPGANITLTLAAAGAGVVGKVSAYATFE